MRGHDRESLLAVVFTINPLLLALLLAIAALIALGILALIPRYKGWRSNVLAFFVYWLVFSVLLLLLIQGFVGRMLITLELIPFEAQSFGILFIDLVPG